MFGVCGGEAISHRQSSETKMVRLQFTASEKGVGFFSGTEHGASVDLKMNLKSKSFVSRRKHLTEILHTFPHVISM